MFRFGNACAGGVSLTPTRRRRGLLGWRQRESGAALVPPYLTEQAASQGAAADEPEEAPTQIEARKAGSRLSAQSLAGHTLDDVPSWWMTEDGAGP